MKRLVALGLFCYVLDGCLALKYLNYSFEENPCRGDIRIDENTEVFVTYTGGKIDYLCSIFSFIGRDANNIKIYQICLETLKYRDPDCDITVGFISTALRTTVYNCTHTPPEEICYEPNKFLKIHIEPVFEMLARNSSFAFKVKAHVTDNGMDLITAILAGAGGGVALIVIVIAGVKCIQRQRSASKKGESNETGTEIFDTPAI